LPWITFSKNFDWSPAKFNGRVTLALPAGLKKLVTRECAEAAAKAGAIESDESR
jgi:hypothetical protein